MASAVFLGWSPALVVFCETGKRLDQVGHDITPVNVACAGRVVGGDAGAGSLEPPPAALGVAVTAGCAADERDRAPSAASEAPRALRTPVTRTSLDEQQARRAG